MQFNVTSLPTVTTTSAPDDVHCSELSLAIDKTDSIEEKDESLENGNIYQKKTPTIDVIKEVITASKEPGGNEKKPTHNEDERNKSADITDSHGVQESKPFEAFVLPPTTTSTQTIPTEEFPDVFGIANQAFDEAETVKTQPGTKVSEEFDSKEARKSYQVSNNQIKRNSFEIETNFQTTPKTVYQSCDEEQQKQCLLVHQQSISQEEDLEVAMVSGLLPGCVAPAPTPAPSIAPLAETEVDPVDDDVTEQYESLNTRPEIERKKKRREKKEKEASESQGQLAEAECSTDLNKSKRNPVCPWEDE